MEDPDLPTTEEIYKKAVKIWSETSGVRSSNPFNNTRYSASIDNLVRIEMTQVLIRYAIKIQNNTKLVEALQAIAQAIHRS